MSNSEPTPAAHRTMTLDNHDGPDRPPSVGVDAVALDRYSGVETDDGQYIVYDEEIEEAWIQSDEWSSLLDAA